MGDPSWGPANIGTTTELGLRPVAAPKTWPCGLAFFPVSVAQKSANRRPQPWPAQPSQWPLWPRAAVSPAWPRPSVTVAPGEGRCGPNLVAAYTSGPRWK